MGIDYVVGLGCDPKRVLGVPGMVEMLKVRSRARSVLDMARARGDRRAPSQITFESMVVHPTGPAHQRLTVKELFDEAALLDVHARRCTSCTARVQSDPFTCWGYISTPILPSSERWLLDRLPSDPRSPALGMLMSAVKEHAFDGEPAARLRANGRAYFEASSPAVRSWGKGKNTFTLSSDQLWQMLFCVGRIRPMHALMCTYFLGLIPHETTADRLTVLAREQERLGPMVRGVEIDAPSQGQIADLAGFLRALSVSASLGVPLVLDP